MGSELSAPAPSGRRTGAEGLVFKGLRRALRGGADDSRPRQGFSWGQLLSYTDISQ